MIRLVIAIAIVGVSLAILTREVHACECEEIDGPWTVTDELNDSLLVFRGVVTSVEIRGEVSWAEVDLSIVTVWKGPVAQEITVWSYAIGALCCYEFEEGVEYIVFANDAGYVSSCSRTGPVGETQQVIETLGAGSAPDSNRLSTVRYVPEWLTPPSPPADKTWVYVGGGFAVWGSLLGAIWLVQRRRRLSRIIRTARDH